MDDLTYAPLGLVQNDVWAIIDPQKLIAERQSDASPISTVQKSARSDSKKARRSRTTQRDELDRKPPRRPKLATITHTSSESSASSSLSGSSSRSVIFRVRRPADSLGSLTIVISLIRDWLSLNHDRNPLAHAVPDVLRAFMASRVDGSDTGLAMARSPGEIAAVESLAEAFERRMALGSGKSAVQVNDSPALRAAASGIWTCAVSAQGLADRGSKVLIWSNAGGKLIRLAMERQMQSLVDLNLSMDPNDGSLRISRFWLAASAVYLESAAVSGCSAEPLLEDQQIERIFDPFFARFVLAPPDLAAHHVALAKVRSPGEIFQLDTSFSLSCARWTRAFCTPVERTLPIDQTAWQLAADCCNWGFSWTVCWFASVRPGITAIIGGGSTDIVRPYLPIVEQMTPRDAEFMRLALVRHAAWSILTHGEIFVRLRTCTDLDDMTFLLDKLPSTSIAIFKAIRALVYEVKSRIDEGGNVSSAIPSLYLQLFWPEIVKHLTGEFGNLLDSKARMETLVWMLQIAKTMSQSWPAVWDQYVDLKAEIDSLRASIAHV